MSVYLFNLFSILIYAAFFEFLPYSRSKKNLLLGGIVCIQFCLIAIFRGEMVGADLPGYLKAFDNIRNMNWEEMLLLRFEYGYLFFNKLLGLLSEEDRILIIGVAFFVTVGFVFYILRESSMPWLSFFLFVALGYYTSSFNILRQFMAMAILVNSIKYVVDRKFYKFILYVLAASCFHITAVIFLILYPLSHLRISLAYFLVAFGCAAVIAKFIGGILLNYLTGNFFELYASNMTSGSGYGLLGLLLLVTGIGLLLRSQKLSRKEEVYYHILIIACCLQVFSLQFSLFSRVVLYFAVHIIIFIPGVISGVKDKEIKSLGILFVCVCCVVYFNLFILTNSDGSMVIPYRFIWDN